MCLPPSHHTHPVTVTLAMNTLYQHTNPRARSRDTTFYLLSANSSQDSIHSHSDGTSNDIDQRSAPPSPLQEQPGECLDRTLDPMPSGSASVAKDDEPTEPPSTPLEVCLDPGRVASRPSADEIIPTCPGLFWSRFDRSRFGMSGFQAHCQLEESGEKPFDL